MFIGDQHEITHQLMRTERLQNYSIVILLWKHTLR